MMLLVLVSRKHKLRTPSGVLFYFPKIAQSCLQYGSFVIVLSYTNAYFEAAIQNRGFRDALQASKGKVLKHSMASGLTKDDTILTEAEFIDVLNLLRDSL